MQPASDLMLLALLWEGVARWQDNDLLLPIFDQAARTFVAGLANGELPLRARASLSVLLQGCLLGTACAFAYTTLAVSTRCCAGRAAPTAGSADMTR